MIATVSGVTIDLSQLVSISMESRGGDWGDFVILTLNPKIQYVLNPDTGKHELHQASVIVEQPCIDADVMYTKYDKWVEKWQEYKDSFFGRTDS